MKKINSIDLNDIGIPESYRVSVLCGLSTALTNKYIVKKVPRRMSTKIKVPHEYKHRLMYCFKT